MPQEWEKDLKEQPNGQYPLMFWPTNHLEKYVTSAGVCWEGKGVSCNLITAMISLKWK